MSQPFGKRHLVIGDPHANPDDDNERFDWLGRLIMDYRPDTVVCVGDFGDMPSLSSYDKGKKSFEGRRFELDVNATIDAQKRMFAPLKEYNAKRKKNKESLYRPRLVMCGGNHDEDRIDRLVNLHSELHGLIHVDMLKYKEHGWEYVPYKTPISIDGVWYCHSFPTGVSGEPISGLNMGQKLLAKNMASSTVGHSHLLDFCPQTRPDGKRMWGLSAGCYWDATPAYARSIAHMWWRGIIVKNNVHDGDYNIELIDINEVKRRYS